MEQSSKRTQFGAKCRELRQRRGLKLRQVAEAIGLSTSTYGNIESSGFRVVGRDRANLIANFHRLDDADRESLLALWEATPLSKFAEGRKEKWREQNERRSAARMLPKMRIALCELAGVHVGAVPEDQICACVHEFAEDSVCEVCTSLELLGLDRFSGDRARTINQLAALQDKLEAERAAAATKAAKP